jgi:transcriptional regulator
MSQPEPTARRDEIPRGTLDLLILKTLARGGELHGFEIVAAISQASNDLFFVEEGSLYPALQRLLVKGWVSAAWSTTAENRRARYYRLTAAGRKQLQAEVAQFERVVGAISRIIHAT